MCIDIVQGLAQYNLQYSSCQNQNTWIVKYLTRYCSCSTPSIFRTVHSHCQQQQLTSLTVCSSQSTVTIYNSQTIRYQTFDGLRIRLEFPRSLGDTEYRLPITNTHQVSHPHEQRQLDKQLLVSVRQASLRLSLFAQNWKIFVICNCACN